VHPQEVLVAELLAAELAEGVRIDDSHLAQFIRGHAAGRATAGVMCRFSSGAACRGSAGTATLLAMLLLVVEQAVVMEVLLHFLLFSHKIQRPTAERVKPKEGQGTKRIDWRYKWDVQAARRAGSQVLVR
jgi:hypothetical protein